MENNTADNRSSFQFPNPFVMIKDGVVFTFKNFWRLAALVLVPIIVLAILEACFFLLEGPRFGSGSSGFSTITQPFPVIASFALGIVFLLGECILIGSILSYIVKKDQGQAAGVLDSFRNGIRKSWPFFCTVFILQLSLVTSGLVFIIPAVILVFYVMFFPFAIIVDGHKDLDALVASYVLVRGAWWRTFGYYLVMLLMVFIVEIVFGVGFSVFVSLMGILSIVLHTIPLVILICAAAVGIIAVVALIIFISSIAAHYFYSYYKSLKSRKSSMFETEFNIARPKGRKFFGILAIIGFLLISTFYISGLYGRYIHFLQNNIVASQQLEKARLVKEVSPVESEATTSAQIPLSAGNIYVSKDGHFEIMPPMGWSLEIASSSPEYGIEQMTAFHSPDKQASIVVTKILMSYERRTAPDSTDSDIAKSLAQQQVAAVEGEFNSMKLGGFQASNLSTQQVGADTAYVYRGSASYGPPIYVTYDFKSLTIFNGTHGYEILSIWPEKEYGWDAATIMESLSSFKAN